MGPGTPNRDFDDQYIHKMVDPAFKKRYSRAIIYHPKRQIPEEGKNRGRRRELNSRGKVCLKESNSSDR